MSKGREPIHLGLIFSVTGPYSAVSQEMLNGALLAIDEVNADGRFDFTFQAHLRDPGAELDAYRAACEEMLRNLEITHVVGCYTSISRKEVMPCFEKYDGLLWYPSHYEGFETSNNVIYTGAAPNQHIVPLAAHMMETYGKKAFCVGSNYIWAWENNRILRELMVANSGSVTAEKYITIGSTDVRHLIDEIEREKPDFIFSTLIGDSRYAFVTAYHELARRNPAFGPDSVPIADCSLSEPELVRIGPEASRGLIGSSVYFQSLVSEENRRFVQRYKARFGANKVTSADAEASYIAVWLMAKALDKAGTSEMEAVRREVLGCTMQAPQGEIRVDPENAHCYLTPRLARALPGDQFEIFYEGSEPVKPDPYLVWLDPSQINGYYGELRRQIQPAGEQRSHLRLVKS